MTVPSLLRNLLLSSALLLPELATAEPNEQDKRRIEKKLANRERELRTLNKERDMLRSKNKPTDTHDLAITLINEELAILRAGKVETTEERLTRTLSNYKRQRALHIKLGQSTAGLDKMIESTERQLKGQPTNFIAKTHIDNKRVQKETSLTQQLGIREQALKYGRSTARADEQIARLRQDLAILNSGKDPETINLELQILDFERNKKTYQKMGQDTSHIDRQIESLQRRLRGEPLTAGTPPSKPKAPTSTPTKPSTKPKPPTSDKMKQAKIRALQHSIDSLQKSIDRIEAKGRPAPKGFLDSLARKKAELAELEK